MADEQVAEPSTAEAEPIDHQQALDGLSASEHAEWLKTGNFPEPKKLEEPASSPAPGKAESEKTEPAPEPGKEAQPKPETRRKITAEERIAQLTAEKKELQEKLARQQQTPRQEPLPPAQAQRQDTQPAAKAPERPVRPKLEAFETYEAYDKALDEYEEKLAVWNAEKIITQREQTARDQARRQVIERQNQEIRANWEKREAEAVKRHPDFKEVVGKTQIPLNPVMDGFLMESELGPDLVYFLSMPENAAESARIAGLGPHATARELTLLEVKLRAQMEEAAKPQLSAAKPPPTELSGARGATEDEAEAAVAARDYQRYEKAQNAKELAARRR